MLCSFLYNTRFLITLDPNLLKPSNNQTMNNDNTVIKSNFSNETENFKLIGNLTVGEHYGKKNKGKTMKKKFSLKILHIF